MSARIPLPDDAELSEDVRKTLAAIPPLNLFRMAARAPAVLRPFLDLAVGVLVRGNFDPRRRELAILRVGHVTRAHYEWVQHVRLAKGLGVSDAEIEAIAVDGPVEDLDEEGRLLCRAADEISADVRLGDETRGLLLERYGPDLTTELVFCLSYFNMVSRFLESTGVELEAEDLIAGRTPGEVVDAADLD